MLRQAQRLDMGFGGIIPVTIQFRLMVYSLVAKGFGLLSIAIFTVDHHHIDHYHGMLVFIHTCKLLENPILPNQGLFQGLFLQS